MQAFVDKMLALAVANTAVFVIGCNIEGSCSP